MSDLWVDTTVPGFCTEKQLIGLAVLSNYINSTVVDHKPRILEIGTWAGRSMITLARNCPRGIITYVDPDERYGPVYPDLLQFNGYGKPLLWGTETSDQLEIRKEVRARLGIGNMEHAILTSDMFFRVKMHKYDMIYIDGDHSPDQLERDIENSWTSLAPWGILCGDDYSTIYPDIMEVVDTMATKLGQVLFVPSHTKLWIMAPTMAEIQRWLTVNW